MKITVEIPDEEFREEVKRLVIRDAVDIIEKDLFGSRTTYNRSIFSDAIKNGVRQLLRENIDNITERAVAAAETTISNRGIKKLMERMAGGDSL